MESSTPIKRIRFRGDSLQDSDPSFDNDFCDEPLIPKYGEIPRERGKFTFIVALSLIIIITRNQNFI
jgi:hypothetical protein